VRAVAAVGRGGLGAEAGFVVAAASRARRALGDRWAWSVEELAAERHATHAATIGVGDAAALASGVGV
jgi:hypothetical protein